MIHTDDALPPPMRGGIHVQEEIVDRLAFRRLRVTVPPTHTGCREEVVVLLNFDT